MGTVDGRALDKEMEMIRKYFQCLYGKPDLSGLEVKKSLKPLFNFPCQDRATVFRAPYQVVSDVENRLVGMSPSIGHI